ncbi:MAG: hypothetical protein IPM06_20830 [Rhizobiales bacterium]|nr:hypothetical protein [Hyphomicrobiales bacterium]
MSKADTEPRRLLRTAAAEIRALRRHNELLNAQVGVMEVFAAALGLRKNENGATIDIVWEIERALMNSDESD